MLRIECSCGKILKVDDALVGKRVKCPGCGELMVVKKPAAAAVAAKPLPATRKRVADDEDNGEEETPRKKKKTAAAKGGSGLLLLLLGGGALFLLLLVAVAGVGAWLFFFKKDGSTDTPGVGGGGGEPVAIKLWEPRQAGNVREVTLKSSFSTGGPQGSTEIENGELRCRIRTLAVNGGMETDWEVTVQSFNSKNMLGGKSGLDVGNVYVGKLRNDSKMVLWSSKADNKLVVGNANWLTRACRHDINNLFFRLDFDDDDAIFGTKDKQAVGATWSGDLDQVRSSVSKGFLGPAIDVTAVKGKLNAVSTEAGQKIADVEITIDAAMDSTKVGKGVANESSKGPITGKFTYRVPVENSKGPVKIAYVLEAKLQTVKAGATQDGSLKDTFDLDIKYLPNESPVDLNPKDTGKDPIDTAKPKETLKEKPFTVSLFNGKASWVPGTNTINWSTEYRVNSGSAKAASKMMLYLVYLDAAGKEKFYEAGSWPDGSQFGDNKAGFLANSVKVDTPPAGQGQLCELRLYEMPPGSNQPVQVASMPGVAVTGTPPTTAPTVVVELSNHKVERKGTKYTMSVDYKFTTGKPDPLATYTLQCDLSGLKMPKGSKQTVEKKPGVQMQPQGTWTASLDFFQDLGQGPNYNMRIAEERNQVATSVSFRDAVGVVNVSADVAKLAIQITGGVQRMGKQGLLVSIGYKVTSGQLDPNANYGLFIELKGGKVKSTGLQPLIPSTPGGLFKTENSVAVPAPNLGETHFDVVVMEFTKENPNGRKVAQVTNGVIMGK